MQELQPEGPPSTGRALVFVDGSCMHPPRDNGAADRSPDTMGWSFVVLSELADGTAVFR